MDKLTALESAAAAVRAARFALKPHDRSLMASCDELLSDIQAEIAHESRRVKTETSNRSIH